MEDAGERLLVAVSVLARQERAADGTWCRLRLESLAWQLDEGRRFVCPLESDVEAADEGETDCKKSEDELLRRAMEKLEASLEEAERRTGRQVRLVACGPLALRQYLRPAVVRAGIELSSRHDEYVDLVKEFSARYHQLVPTTAARTTSASQQIQQQQQQQQHWFEWQEWHALVAASTCCCSSASSASGGSQASSSAYGSAVATSEPPLCYCYPHNLYFGYPQQQHQQHQAHQEAAEATPQSPPRGANNNNRPSSSAAFGQVEAMLEFLSIEPKEEEEGEGEEDPSVSDKEEEEEMQHGTTLPPQDEEAEEGQQVRAESLASGHCPSPATTSSRCNSGSGGNEMEERLRANRRLVAAMSLVVARMLNEGHPFERVEPIKRQLEVGLCEPLGRDDEHRVVRARGLPWQASEQDIAGFFVGLNIARGGVGLCLSRQGRRNGEALIRFESREHRNLALGRHKHFMGARYIEVYRASADDFLGVAPGQSQRAQAFLSRGAQVIVRMRGLPFSATAQQVLQFFASTKDVKSSKGPCEVLSHEEGVLFVRNQEDKPTGDAFVLFASDEMAQRALARHKQTMGARYVELFRSSVSEVQQVLSMSQQQQQQHQQQANTKTAEPATVKRPTAWPLPDSTTARPPSQQPTNVASRSGVTWAQVATSSLQVSSSSSSGGDQQTTTAAAAKSDEAAEKEASPECPPASPTSSTQPLVGAQSPISSLSAASTASSSYKSSHYNGSHHHHHHRPNSNNQTNRHRQQQQQPPLPPLPPHQLEQLNLEQAMQQRGHFQHHQRHQLAYAPHPFHFYPSAPATVTPPTPTTFSQPTGSDHQLARRDCVRLRGLPFEAQVEDVLYFLAEHSRNILQQGVHMVLGPQGQPSGEAVVQMASCQAASEAAQAVHKRVMCVGKKQRYIEVMPCSLHDLHFMLGLHLMPPPPPPPPPQPHHHHHHHHHQLHQAHQPTTPTTAAAAYFRPAYYSPNAADEYLALPADLSSAPTSVVATSTTTTTSGAADGANQEPTTACSDSAGSETPASPLETIAGHQPPEKRADHHQQHRQQQVHQQHLLHHHQPYYPILYYYPHPHHHHHHPAPPQMVAHYQ